MALSNGALGVFGVNACNVQAYSPIWTRVCVWCNHVNGSGVGFVIKSKHLQKVKANVLIMCSSYNVSQSPPMYWHKQMQVFWWPFSPPGGGKDKHQEKKTKKMPNCNIRKIKCNQNKRICKARWTSIRRAYGIWWYVWGQIKAKWKTSMMSMDAIHVCN